MPPAAPTPASEIEITRLRLRPPPGRAANASNPADRRPGSAALPSYSSYRLRSVPTPSIVTSTTHPTPPTDGPVPLRCLLLLYSSYRLRSVPTPSIVTSTVLPGFMEPTPTEVPQQMTSPGCSVMSCDIALTIRSG